MISLYSNWWIKPGKEKKVIPLLHKLAKKVKDKEPGTLMYTVHTTINQSPRRSNKPPKKRGKRQPSAYFKSEPLTRPGVITFVETYASWNAFNDHVNGDIFQGFLKKYSHLFVQAETEKGKAPSPFIQVVFLDREAGFIREKKNVIGG